MKRLLALALVLCMVFSMMPVSARAETTQATGNTEISLWTYPIGGWSGELLDDLIAEFESDNPGITVNVTHLDYMTGDALVNEAIANGTTPDLILEGPERLVSQWGNGGHLLDLSGLLDDTDRAEIYPNALSAGYGSDGNLYMYPLCSTVHTMAINKTVFEAAGAMQYLNEENHTWNSTEDFFKAVQAVYEYTGKDVGVVYYGGRGGDQGTRALVNNLFGGTYTNASHTAYTWDSPENVDALKALYNCEGIRFDGTIVGGDEIAQFYSGTLNMAFCWNIVQQLNPNIAGTGTGRTASGDEILFIAFPSDGTPQLCGGIWGLGVFENYDSARADAAKTFVKYMCDSEKTASAVTLSDYFAVRDTAGVYDLTEIWSSEPTMYAYAPLAKLQGDYYVVTPNWGNARGYWLELLADVAEGQDAASAAAYWTAMANGSTPVTPGQKTQLHLVAPIYGENSAAWWQQFEADFEAAHTDIDLVADILSWDDIYSHVATLIEAGNAPDILNIDGYASYLDMLLPVEEYMSQETYAKFPLAFLEQSIVDGAVWAVPDLASTRALYYNKDIFDELGLEAPTNMAELWESAQAITAGSKLPGLGMDMTYDEGFATFAQFIWAVGGDFLDADGNWDLNSDLNVEAVQIAAGMVLDGVTNSDPANQNRYDLQDMFANGQLAMLIAPDSFRFQLSGINYGVTPIPTETGTSHGVGVMDRFMSFDNGQSLAEMAAITAFFDFFYEDNCYADWAAMEGFLPATTTGMDALIADNPEMAPWKPALENAKFYPAHKAEWLTVRDGVVDVLQQAIAGGDPQALLDALQAEIAGTDVDTFDGITIWAASNNVDWVTERVEAYLAENPDLGVEIRVEVCDNAFSIHSDPENAADVFYFANDYLGSLTGANAIAPLSDAAAEQAAARVGDAMITSVTAPDGKIYGIPYSSNTWFMYYNKNIFSDEDVKSLEAMLEKGVVAFPLTNSWYLASFYFANGGTMFGPNANDASAGIQFGGAAGTAVTRYLVTLLDNDNFRNDANGLGSSGLMDGSVGAYFSGSWDYWNLQSQLGDALGAAQLPTITIDGEQKQLKSFLGSTAYGVSAYTDYPEIAEELALYLTSAESQKLFYQYTGSTPAAVSLITDSAISANPVVSAQMKTAAYTATPQPWISAMATYWGCASDMGNALVNGDVTLENAAVKTEEFNNAINGVTSQIYSGICGDNLTWMLSNGVLTISGEGEMYDFDSSDLPWSDIQGDILEIVVENGVTTIGSCAFVDCANVTRVSLPDTLTTIENSVFIGCASLVEITIPDNVTTVGGYAFQSCWALDSVTVGKAIQVIGDYAFEATGLDSITFRGNAPLFGMYTFHAVTATAWYPAGNDTWTEDIMQNYGGTINWVAYDSIVTEGICGDNLVWSFDADTGLLTISGTGAMYDYQNSLDVMNVAPWAGLDVTGVVVESGVTYIGICAFRSLPITSVSLPDTVTVIGNGAFDVCLSLSKIQLPEKLVTLGDGAFSGCPLTELTIPASVSAIGNGTFSGCDALKTITFLGDAPSFGYSSFYNVTATVYYPRSSDGWTEDVLQNYNGNLTWVAYVPTVASGICGDNLTWTLDAEGLLTISGTGAMHNYEMYGETPWNSCGYNVLCVLVEEGVTTIGDSAFNGCGSAVSISLPSSLTEIGAWAFESCYALAQIDLPENLKKISHGAFSYCDSLTEITIPASVQEIGAAPFRNCSKLASIVVEEGNACCVADEQSVLYDAAMTTLIQAPLPITGEYQIPDTVTVIGQCAFQNCGSLTGVTLPAQLVEIYGAAFSGCSSLKSIGIPASVNFIDTYAFSNCSALESITFEGNAPVMGPYSFGNVTAAAYYPANNATWTEDVMQDYGGNLTWVEYDPFSFRSFAELKRLVARYQTEYIGAVNYVGDEPLVIEEDIHIPWTMGIGSHEQPVIVPEGVTIKTDNLFYATDLTINGTMNAVAVEIGDALAVNGILNVTAQVYLYHQNVVFTGEENINFLDSAILCQGYDVKSMDQLLEALDTAKADTNPRHIYSIAILEQMTIDQTLTLPENAQLLIDKPMTIAAGCTLTTSYMCAFRSDVTVEGTLINTNGVSVLHNDLFSGSLTIAKGGKYQGTGIIRVHIPGGDDPTVVLSGIDTSRFDIAFDEQGGGWIMTPKKVPTPTVKTSTISSTGKIKISWAAVEGAVRYEVYCAESKNGPYSLLIATNATSTIHANAEIDTTYYYYVIAVDSIGNSSEKSSIVSRLCLPAVPAKPYKIANVVSGVHVYWKEVKGAVKYGLWRSETGVNGTYKWIANPTVPHFTDTSVESGKTYHYKVTAMNAAGTHTDKSAALGIVYVDTPDITSRVNKAAGISLGWQKIEGATGYAIYRKSYSGTDAWVRVGTISGNSTFTWTDTSVKNNNGTVYRYTIRALAGSNMATLSGCRNTGRTMARLTSRTLNTAAKASATSIKCSWGTSSAVTGYEVRFMVGDQVYKTFLVSNYKTGTKTFTGLPAGRTYKIQVRAYLKVDGVGSFYSAWSVAKNVTL